MTKPNEALFSDHPFAASSAAKMLSAGLEQASARTGLSMRQLAPSMGYATSVALSHMANGRVPIPIDRVEILAERLEIDRKAFLTAVLRQRHPDVDFTILAEGQGHDRTSTQFEDLTGGMSIDELTVGQRRVIREVMADPQAARRWLSPHEVAAVQRLRAMRPAMATDGLGRLDMAAIETALQARPQPS